MRLLVRGGFLFERFKPECYWFCNVSLIRNFFVAVLPCVIPALDVTLLLMTLTLLIALVLLVWYKPRKTPNQQLLDTFIGIVQLTVLSIGVTTAHGQLLSTGLSTACVILIVSVVTAVLGLIILKAYQRVSSIAYPVYLSHHSGVGGSSTRLLYSILGKVVKGSIFYDIDHRG